MITLSATYQQTKSLIDPVTGTYKTMLIIDPSLDLNIVGTYNCTVENVRGESSETVIVPGETLPLYSRLVYELGYCQVYGCIAAEKTCLMK